MSELNGTRQGLAIGVIKSRRPGSGSTAEVPKRLAPKPETMLQLFALSGNECAMPDCDHVMVDRRSVQVGRVCHIRAALPDSARFDGRMTNEERRDVSNLVLMCEGHHTQIDSRAYEEEFTLERVVEIKRRHEARFRGAGQSLRKAASSRFADSTDILNPTAGGDFAELERVLPHCRVDEEREQERAQQVRGYLDRLRRVPDEQRDFMLNVIKRAIKLDAGKVVDVPLVSAHDLVGALRLSNGRVERLGLALGRYDVGAFEEVGMAAGDEWRVRVDNPSEHLSWFEIAEFCAATGADLDDFVMRLKFDPLAIRR